GVEALGADPGAVADIPAAEHAEVVVEGRQALVAGGVPAVLEKALGLEQRRGAQVLVRVPPPGRAPRGAAGAENAFVEAVEPRPLLRRLAALGGGRGLVVLQIGLDLPVLVEERLLVYHQVADH